MNPPASGFNDEVHALAVWQTKGGVALKSVQAAGRLSEYTRGGCSDAVQK